VYSSKRVCKPLATAMPSLRAVRSADQPSGPSVAMYTASGRSACQCLRSVRNAGSPNRIAG
jgi:hypothetical protein